MSFFVLEMHTFMCDDPCGEHGHNKYKYDYEYVYMPNCIKERIILREKKGDWGVKSGRTMLIEIWVFNN